MKKIIIIRMLIASFSLILNTYLHGQSSHTTPFMNPEAANHIQMLAAIKTWNAKAFGHFTTNYPKAILNNVRTENDGTHLNASQNGNNLRVTYDKKGRFMNSVYTYPCADLKDQIAEEVEQNFPGYLIYGTVVEVKVRDKSALLVLIENKKSWKRVRITDDGIDVFEEYNKPS